MSLADYKELIGTAASMSSIILLLSPVSTLLLQQGLVMRLKPVVVTHSVGMFLNFCYISVYIAFTKDKFLMFTFQRTVKKTLIGLVCFLVPLIAYVHLEDKTLVETRFGTLMTLITVIIMCYHLYNLRHVIKTKDTKDLPFPILVAACLVTFLWTLYGTAINKPSLQLQTGFSFLVIVFQLSLFAVFPSKPTELKKTD